MIARDVESTNIVLNNLEISEPGIENGIPCISV